MANTQFDTMVFGSQCFFLVPMDIMAWYRRNASSSSRETSYKMQLLTWAWVVVLHLQNNLILDKGRRVLVVSEVPHTLNLHTLTLSSPDAFSLNNALSFTYHPPLWSLTGKTRSCSTKCHYFLAATATASIARGSHTRRGSSDMLDEGSADTVRTELTPVRETFDRRLFRTPLQLLGILNAHLLW